MATDFQWQPETPFAEWEDEQYDYDHSEFLGEDEVVRRPAGSAVAFARPAGPVPAPPAGPSHGPATTLVAGVVFAGIVGTHQGSFAGGSTAKGHEGWIAGTGFDYEVKSPRDPASGLATGRRQQGAVTLTKPWDASSPQLFHALVANETLSKVTFEFPGTRPDGQEQVGQRITLTNAFVSDLRRVSDASLASAPFERVAFTFQTIVIEDVAGGTMAQDDRGAAHVSEFEEFEFEQPEFEQPEFEEFGVDSEGENWVVESYELADAGVVRVSSDVPA